MPCEGGPNPWQDSTLEELVSLVRCCSLESAATATSVLEDAAHVLFTMPPPPLPPSRGHFERLLTRPEMEELRRRVAEAEEIRREMAAMAAEDEASTRWRVAAAAEETAKQSQ